MIPRFASPFDAGDILQMLTGSHVGVTEFEEAFARSYESRFAIAFPYGRSAIWAFFMAMEIEGAEVIMPAYTCSVVAHAVVLSHNTPVFCDIELSDYNCDPSRIAELIGPKTRAIIATNTFGYPQDGRRLMEIRDQAQARYGHPIYIIQDCAHCFAAKFNCELVARLGDVAIFGLNLSKSVSAIFGGMLVTNNEDIASRAATWRNRTFVEPGPLREWALRVYGLVAHISLSSVFFRLTHFLSNKTRLLTRLTDAYHLDDKIHFPKNHLELMSKVSASVGLRQLVKQTEHLHQRVTNAARYDEHLDLDEGWIKPPLTDGATYSHYVVRVPDRDSAVKSWMNRGVQLGVLIQYSIPHLDSYGSASARQFPNSFLASQHLVNFPINADSRTLSTIISRSR